MLTCPVFAQNAKVDTSKIEPWLGEFAGILTMYSTTKAPSTIPMSIKNFATDTLGTYGWFLIYGEDEKSGTRSYYLKEVDAAKGHYVVDEKNSILLDSYLIGNKLISNFEVEGVSITSIYTLLDKDTISFEIIAGKSDNPNITGGQDEISTVTVNSVSGYHYGKLKRVSVSDK